jgi:periplasmic divalent cation tolerance protein
MIFGFRFFRRNIKMLIVMTTVSTIEEGKSLAAGIVDERLAACVQVLPKMTSFYVWKGKVESADEFLLLAKTTREKYAGLEAYIQARHSYETPEIVAVSAEAVSAGYAAWLTESLV